MDFQWKPVTRFTLITLKMSAPKRASHAAGNISCDVLRCISKWNALNLLNRPSNVPTALEMKDKIQSGLWWQECGYCLREMHDGYLEDDGDEIPYTISVSTKLDDVFCSRRCRCKAEKKARQVARRKRRTICRAVKVLGPSIRITYASGDTRSGWCKCDLEKMRTDYPGYVEFKFPGGKYSSSGCPWCGQWGVSNCDTEAWHQWRSEVSR